VISSVNDLSRWVLFNLNRGQWEGKTVVSARALAQLQTPQMPSGGAQPRYPELSYQSYGLGWFIDAYRGSLRISHPGNLYGFTAMVSFLPRERLGMVALANLNGTPLTEIVERFVYDALLGLPVVDWSTRTKNDYARMRAALEKQAAAPDPGRKSGARLTRALDAYAGTYTNPGYGTLVVGRAGDALTVTVRSGTFPLEPYADAVLEFYHPVEDQRWLLAFGGKGSGAFETVAIDAGPGLKPIVFSRAADRARAQKLVAHDGVHRGQPAHS
jgi:hypothetical protein